MSWKSALLRPGIRRRLGLDVPRKERIAAELEEEMQLHLELRAEQLQKRGVSAVAAHQMAIAQYGAIDDATQQIRTYARRQEQHMQRRISFESFVQDVQFALRTLGRAKSWTAVAVLTFALGIGASAAVFSVTNNLLFDPLHYPHGDRLVLVSSINKKSNVQISPSNSMVQAWHAAKTIDAIEGVSSGDVTFVIASEPSTARVARVSPTFVSFSGARVLAGRSFVPGDNATGASPVVMLSEHTWKTRFGGAKNVIGQTFKVDDQAYAVIGVLADGVRTPSYSSDPIDMWLPLQPDANLGGPAVARLAGDATLAQAEQELRAMFMNSPGSKGLRDSGFDIKLQTPGNGVASSATMYMLSGAVCLLLLIACANVTHLLLARGAARERELSIRAALGAGRARIARQLVTEGVLLAIAGCVVGISIAAVALKLIDALRPATMSELANVPLYTGVTSATVLLSLLAGAVFGCVSALGHRSGLSFEVLRASIATTGDRRRHRVRSLLVVMENALSVVLLVGSILLIRTVNNLYQVDPGFDANDVYAMTVDLPRSRYDADVSRQLYAERLVDDARKLPGVMSATIATYAPTRSGATIGDWETDDGAAVGASPGFTPMNAIAPGYFELMRMKFVAGRDMDGASRAHGEVVISRSLARELFGEKNALGHRFRQSGSKRSDAWSTIVGIVADAAVLNLRDGKASAIYYPADEAPSSHLSLIVRMKSGATPHAALRRLSLAIDPVLAPPPVLSAKELLQRTVARERFMMSLLTSFAGIAVILSAVGLYGVISYVVSQSTREIGVRVALGATRGDVMRGVIRQGFTLSTAGIVAGLLASVWGARLLTSTVYGVSTTDPASYALGSLVLQALASCACIAPTLRAIRIDPMVAMRSE